MRSGQGRSDDAAAPRGRLRLAMNSYRRRVELDILATTARLEAADRLAEAVEAAADAKSPDLLAALRAYREASRSQV